MSTKIFWAAPFIVNVTGWVIVGAIAFYSWLFTGVANWVIYGAEQFWVWAMVTLMSVFIGIPYWNELIME